MTIRRLVPVLVALALVAAACGDDDGDDTAATTTEAAEEATTTTAGAEDGGLPDTPVTASLDDVTDFEGNPVDDAPFAPGEITVRWYAADVQDLDRLRELGFVWAAVYDGLDAESVICPGNSIGIGGGEFDAVSNSPVAEGSCDGAPAGATILDGSDGTGVQLCGDQVGYVTLIPADASGTLFASMADFSGDGVSWVGTTQADPAAAPEIDPADLSC